MTNQYSDKALKAQMDVISKQWSRVEALVKPVVKKRRVAALRERAEKAEATVGELEAKLRVVETRMRTINQALLASMSDEQIREHNGK